MRLVHNSLHVQVAATLREQIFAGTLAPGSFVDEVALCESLKISRTPLREALKVLTAEGLVRHEPRRGCFVNEVTEQDLDEIFPVIALLEGRCAHEAARNASDTDLAVLEVLHERLQKAARGKHIVDYYDTNFSIHEAIITLANNRWLAQVIGDLRKILKLARLQQLHAPGRLEQSLREHMAVFAALKARDCEGAEAAMRTHLTRQREALRELAHAQKSRRLA
jgi:DNA-binding GntR family transcriptional regulator